MTRRDQKKEKTRERILSEAQRLFEAQGYEDTTTDQIAVAAEVARRTFFRYFPSKEAVLFPHRERRLGAFRAVLSAAPRTGEPLDAVRRALFFLAEDYEAHRREVMATQRIVERSPALLVVEASEDRPWEMALAEALGDRPRASAAARRRARVWAGALMGAIRATLREWSRQRGRVSLHSLAEDALALLAAGLQTSTDSEGLARGVATRENPS